MPSSQICTPLLPATVPRESQRTLVLRAFLAVCVSQDSRTQQEQVFLLLDSESGSPGGVSLLRPCHAIMSIHHDSQPHPWHGAPKPLGPSRGNQASQLISEQPLTSGHLFMGEGGSSASSVLDRALALPCLPLPLVPPISTPKERHSGSHLLSLVYQKQTSTR